MNAAIVTGILLAAAFGALGGAKIAKSSSMRARAEHVGFSVERYQLIGAAEVLGALGVAAGLVYAPIGYAAATGLLALLAGAVLTHLRSGDPAADLGPAALFAVGTVAYLLALGPV